MRPGSTNSPDTNLPAWVQRLKFELQRDKKKTAVMLALAVTAAVVVTRVLLSSRVPQAAHAAESPAAAAASSVVVADGAGDWQAAAPDRRLEASRREEYIARLDRRIQRDLFKPSLEYFPPGPSAAGSSVVLSASRENTPGWFGRVRQWIADKQAAQQEQMARVGVIRAQAQSLALQSIIVGRAPAALINGQVLREGDRINGFLLKRITSTCCVLSKDKVDVQLHMNR